MKEETRAYQSMINEFRLFEEMKKSLSKRKCSVHNKRLKMEANWEMDMILTL